MKKSCELLNLNVIEILSNKNGEMDLEDLKQELTKHVSKHPHRSIIINANAGSTIRGAIDNIPVINTILKEITEQGTKTTYTIHADGAYLGLILPIIKPFGEVSNYFTDIGVNTMSICATKFLGLPVSSIVLVKKDFLDISFDESSIINYAGGISDTTITGCRSSHNVLLLHNALYSIKLNENNNFLTKIVQNNFRNAEYFYERIVNILGQENVEWNKYQFNILFKRPSTELVKKYTLMPVGDNMCSVTIIQHVNKKKMDEFLEELATVCI